MKTLLALVPVLLIGCAPVAEPAFVYIPSTPQVQTLESGVDIHALIFSNPPSEVMTALLTIARDVQFEAEAGRFPFAVASQSATQVVLTTDPPGEVEPLHLYFDLILNADGSNLVFQMPGVSSKVSWQVWQTFSEKLKLRLAAVEPT